MGEAALRILQENPRCASVVDGARSARRRGQFYVACLDRDGESFNVWFEGATP